MQSLFLVEAGTGFGLGHVMRSRVLINQAAASGCVSHVWIRGDFTDATVFCGHNIHVRHFPAETSTDVIFTQAQALANKHTLQFISIDGYGFSYHNARTELLSRIASDTRILILDDLANTTVDADVILNQNTENSRLYVNTSATMLLGPRYALIDEKYRIEAAPDANADASLSVLISFGGLDKKDWTTSAVRAVRSSFHAATLNVVMGPFFGERPALTQWASEGSIKTHYGLNDLSGLMSQCHILVCAAGSTVWQACCVGLPMIAVGVVDNQLEIVNTLRQHQAARVIHGEGLTEEARSAELRSALQSLSNAEDRATVSCRAKHLVDGKGALRVLDILMKGSR